MGILSKVSKGAKALAEAFESEKAGKALSAADEAAIKAAEHVSDRPEKSRSVIAKKPKAVPPPMKRAPAKTKEEISKIAERIAPQFTDEFVRGRKGTASVAGKSKKQFDLEKEYEHDIRATKELPSVGKVDLSKRKGDVMLSLPGDYTISDQDIYSIAGRQLREPSRQYGGPRYGLGAEDAGWASGFSPAAAFQRRAIEASKQYGDAPVLANYLMMGPEGMNYALHFSDALLKSIDPSKLAPEAIETINQVIRAGTPKHHFADFVGIEHPEEAYMQMAQYPKLRKHFNSIMQMPTFTEAVGLPSGSAVRHAVTEPALRDLERGMTGHSLIELNPEITKLSPSEHPTYAYDIPGQFLGEMPVMSPYELTFPDVVKSIRENPKQAGSEFGTLQMGGGKQIIDQQLIDEIGEYQRRMKELTGKKKGGLVHMADGGTPPVRKPISELIPLDDANLSPTVKSPIAKTIGKVAKGVHEFVSKPFGYENPPGKFISELFGIPAIGRTAENIAYGTPITTGSGQTLSLSPDTAEAALTVLPSAPLAGKLAVKAAPAVGKVAKASAPYAGKLAQEYAEKTQMGFPLQMNVMKPKGGNWLSGATEKLTDPFKYKYAGGKSTQETLDEMNRVYNPEALALMSEETRQSVTRHLPQLQREAVLEKWVDQKLGKYIKNEMATPEDPIRLGIERRAVEAEALKELNNKKLAKMQSDIDRAKAAGKDTTLSENDLAAAKEKFDDEYTIASRGLYHKTAPEGGWTGDNVWEPETVLSRRVKEGFPERGMGKTPASTAWEIEADAEIRPFTAEDLISSPSSSNVIQENPFLSKIDPKSKVYSFSDNALDVGLEFRHMIDEVKAAMDPASNLPKSLRISPKDLEKMTVDDVSALSGKISAWRDVQKTKADLQLANNPAVHTFKEYPPENNPKGVSWRQIKRPEGMPDDEAEKYVREATKYEGDIMRHCVGGAGHCEPLLNGEVEIYSLRDAKGEPHVTIEVSKPDIESGIRRLPEEERQALKKKVLDNYYGGAMPGRSSEEQYYEILKQEYESTYGMPKPIIEEIKGKNNRKPNDEYIPFIQDFIKSGQWSDVGDIANTDLVKHNGKYLTKQEYDDYLLKELNPDQGMAKGGVVSNNDLESRMNAMLAKGYAKGYAKGGAVNSGSLEDKMNKMLAAAYAPKKMADGGFTKVGSFKIGGRISLIKH
jgi:hypothetical protein